MHTHRLLPLVLALACANPDPTDASDDPADTDLPDTDETDAPDTDDTDPPDTDVVETDETDDTELPVVCTEGETRCADTTTLEVCEGGGTVWRSFPCNGPCDDVVVPPACSEADLEGWELHVFEDVPSPAPLLPVYTFEEDGTVAIQGVNALPSAYTNTVVRSSYRVSGQVTVNTSSDDDFVGIVFGWQDPEHFYLVDWKQTDQPDATCGTASRGVSLKKVSAAAPIDECVSLWASVGSASVTPLSAASSNPVGWADFTTYTFVLEHRPGDIRVEVKQGTTVLATITSTDATWGEGRFGFYNYSQEAVRYELVTFEPLP